MRVLVVEDDKELNNFIRTALKREGFVADSAPNGKEALRLAQETDYDVILLDVVMPELNGLAALKELRQRGDPAAILMVTSQNHERDKLAGLNNGADDYLVKPFMLTELIARIRAVLRRRQPGGHNGNGAGTLLTAGDLRMDLVKHAVDVKGKLLELTKKEFELLEYFMRHPNHVLSQSAISQHIWNIDFDGESNVVEVHVAHLREKMGTLKSPQIVTVRGAGYRFEP
jgi:DNA-binding response OmpR family regulator